MHWKNALAVQSMWTSFLYYLGKQKKILDIVEQEPLNVSHIKKLSPHSNRYIIPCNQSNCKMHSLILYNTENRPGADEEAKKLEDSLGHAGFTEPTLLEWT